MRQWQHVFSVWYLLFCCDQFKTMVKTAEEGVAVTVFFEKGIEQDKIDEIGKEIKNVRR